jgi:hypothetical protein
MSPKLPSHLCPDRRKFGAVWRELAAPPPLVRFQSLCCVMLHKRVMVRGCNLVQARWLACPPVVIIKLSRSGWSIDFAG